MRGAAPQNIFRICGDFAHLFSFFILFYKIFTTKQVGGAPFPPGARSPVPAAETGGCGAGISLKTQCLYVLVFCTRYIDLLWNFASMYNWCMKVRAPPAPRVCAPMSAAGLSGRVAAAAVHRELREHRVHHAAGAHARAPRGAVRPRDGLQGRPTPRPPGAAPAGALLDQLIVAVGLCVWRSGLCGG